MATSANSIIKFYQDASTTNTAANSANDLLSEPLSINEKSNPLQQSSQAPYSPSKTLASSFIFNKIENLPTAISNETKVKNKDFYDSKSNNSSGVISSNSFFTIPLRFFSLKKRQKAPNDETYDDDFLTSAELDNTALDIISDSPIGCLIQRETIDEILDDHEEESQNDDRDGTAPLDPIYETYIRYVYHTQDGETIGSETDCAEDDDQNGIRFTDSPTIIGDDDYDGDINRPSIRNSSNGGNPRNSNNGSNEALPRTSTLKRIKTKTKQLLKQISVHYENEFKNFNENSFKPTKNELKRRLSGYSMRHTSSIKRFKANHFGETYPDKSLNSKGRGLLALFDSNDFNQRLSEGSVSARKEYNNENQFEDYDEEDDSENYHMSYKLNHNYGEVAQPITNSFTKLFKKLSIKRHSDNNNENIF